MENSLSIYIFIISWLTSVSEEVMKLCKVKMSQSIQPANFSTLYASSQKSKKEEAVKKKVNVELIESSRSPLVSKGVVDTVNRLGAFSFDSPSVDKPLFHFFESQNQIPKAILAQEQENLIHQLFEAWHLDSRLCLMDLLGLQINHGLTTLLGSNKEAEEVLKTFAAYMCLTYLQLFRQAQMQKCQIPVSFNSPELEKFYGPQKIEKYFGETLIGLIRTTATFKNANIATRVNLSDTMKRNLIRACEVKEKQLSGYVEIFNTLWKHEKDLPVLIGNQAFRLSGAENLNREEQDAELQDLTSFITYIDTLLTSGQARGAIPMITPCFREIKAGIQKKDWKKITSSLTESSESLYREREAQIGAYARAASRELTQEQWAEENKVKITDPKSQQVFAESLNLVVLSVSLTLAFIEDVQTLVDRYFDRYIPELFFPRKRIIQRAFLNLSVLVNPPVTKEGVVQKTLAPFFQLLLDQMSQFIKNEHFLTHTKLAHISQIKAAKKTLESQLSRGSTDPSHISQIQPQLSREITDEEFYARAAATERRVEEGMSKLANSKGLQEISEFYNMFIHDQLPSALSLLIESLSECSPEQIAEAQGEVFRAGLPVIRIGMVLRDLKALKEQRYPTDEQLQPQLLNLLTLNGLETAMKRKEHEKDAPSAQSEEVLVQSSSEREEPELLKELEKELGSSQQIPIFSSKRSKSVQQKPKTASVQEPETFTVSQNTRIREVEAQLEQLGLVPLRSKGSHTYYGVPKKGDQPAQFVTQISYHSGRGSLGPVSKRIENQVKAFLERKEKAPKN